VIGLSGMEPTQPPEVKPPKPPTFLYVCMFFLGLIGIIGLRYLQVHRVHFVTDTTTFEATATPTPMPFAYHPPTTAVTGSISAVSGKVEKTNWNSDDMTEASPSAQIFQSEKIVTQPEATASVTLENIARIDLDNAATVNFTSLIPDRILFTQPAGLVTYTALDDKLISVRTLTLILTFKNATVKVEPDAGYIYLNQVAGESTFATVDSNNNTQTYTLKEKHRATIYDADGSVYIR
jgi:hypothetical protein